MHEPTVRWHSTLHIALLHPTRAALLMQPENGVWALPQVQGESRMPLRQVAFTNQMMAQVFGLHTTVLRYLDVRDTSGHCEAIGLLEAHDPTWQPPPAWQWMTDSDLDTLLLRVPEHRQCLRACMQELARDTPPHPPCPWTHTGWFARVEAWIDHELGRRGQMRVAPIEQVSSWSLSCVLRARTMTGQVYCKALPPILAHEPVLLQVLSAHDAIHIPQPLAIQPEEGWMLLADFGPDLRGTTERQVWYDALRTFAAFQRASAGYVETLRRHGCPHRPLQSLPAAFATLLQDTVALTGLAETEVGHLCHLVPRVQQCCDALAAYQIPETIVHGDVHLGNMANPQGHILFFDWTDGCVSHPFLDPVVMRSDTQRLPDAAAMAEPLRQAYLAPWAALASMPHLYEAWRLAGPLGAVHQAMNYYRITTHMEAAHYPELTGGLQFWLRQVLRAFS
jgi:aminoglycoside phosphotransferase (APT) family kinase protein